MSFDNFMEVHHKGKELSAESMGIIKNFHYSKSARTQLQVHVFELLVSGQVKGVAIFGLPLSRHEKNGVLELRRFCLVPDMPKNTSSYFLSKCLKWLRKNDPTIHKVITFADPAQGHVGTIYKATNFSFVGEQKHISYDYKCGDRNIHQRQVYQKRDGEYTTNALMIQLAIKEGLVEKIRQQRKLKYEYKIA